MTTKLEEIQRRLEEIEDRMRAAEVLQSPADWHDVAWLCQAVRELWWEKEQIEQRNAQLEAACAFWSRMVTERGSSEIDVKPWKELTICGMPYQGQLAIGHMGVHRGHRTSIGKLLKHTLTKLWRLAIESPIDPDEIVEILKKPNVGTGPLKRLSKLEAVAKAAREYLAARELYLTTGRPPDGFEEGGDPTWKLRQALAALEEVNDES